MSNVRKEFFIENCEAENKKLRPHNISFAKDRINFMGWQGQKMPVFPISPFSLFFAAAKGDFLYDTFLIFAAADEIA